MIRTRGGAWMDSPPMEGQEERAAHADFMGSLVEGWLIDDSV